jgi:hypothetical protein
MGRESRSYTPAPPTHSHARRQGRWPTPRPGGRGGGCYTVGPWRCWRGRRPLDGQALAQARAFGQAPPEVSLPVGFTTFPGEIWRTPRSWAEKAYPNLTYSNEVDKGGHFAAWEEPQLFSEEVRAAFSSLR